MAEPQEGTLFKAEYERELEAWLRRRYGFLLGATFVWYLLMLLISTGVMLVLRWSQGKVEPGSEDSARLAEAQPLNAVAILTTVLTLAIAARAFAVVRRKLETRQQTLRAASWFIVQVGAVSYVGEIAMALVHEGQGWTGFAQLFFLHFASCLFLPWTPRESLRPMYPLASLFLLELVILRILGALSTEAIVGYLIGMPFVLLPGLLICWIRLRRRRRAFNREMVTRGYFSMRRELNQARAVQLALFPKTIRADNLLFDFAYVPANEVGGDFIHASVDRKGRLDVVLLDVTGHGLASALTVSRLSGEIERLLAENPDIEPAQVLRMLNRYVNLTLSRHNVYATALALQVDPTTGEVTYANAGHPPAFVRRASGAVERFDSTTWLLGAAPDSMFEQDQLNFTLGPRDTLILLTDGVHEAPDRKGVRFGLERVQESLSRTPEPERWTAHLSGAADSWRSRIADDDLLVASIRVPLAAPAAPRARPRALDIEMDTALGIGMAMPGAGGFAQQAQVPVVPATRAPEPGGAQSP